VRIGHLTKQPLEIPISYGATITNMAHAADRYSRSRGRSNALLALAMALAGAANAAAPAPVLPAWVSALSIGQWAQIPNTAMAGVAPSARPAGSTGPESKVVAWTSFVVDTRTSKVYSVANGGHSDYAGNEVDVLDLETAAPAWRQVLAPTPDARLTNCQSYYADDTPAARHSYYGATLDEFGDRIMLFGGAIWCIKGGFFTPISSYNVAANAYSPPAAHGNLPDAFAGVTAYSLDPSTGDVYAFLYSNYGRWNRSSNTFAKITPKGRGPEGGSAMSAMDTTRGRILIVGGYRSDRHTYTLSSNTFAPVTLAGAGAAEVSRAGQGALVYVAAADRYLVRLGGPGGTVYQIHPATFEVAAFPTTKGEAIPETQNGPYNKFLYVPRLKGIVYVPSYSGNAWFLRIH